MFMDKNIFAVICHHNLWTATLCFWSAQLFCRGHECIKRGGVVHNISTDAIIVLAVSSNMIKHEAGLNNFLSSKHQTIDL